MARVFKVEKEAPMPGVRDPEPGPIRGRQPRPGDRFDDRPRLNNTQALVDQPERLIITPQPLFGGGGIYGDSSAEFFTRGEGKESSSGNGLAGARVEKPGGIKE